MRRFVVVFALLTLAACGSAPTPAASPTQVRQLVTIIGYTEVTTGHHVDRIDINDVPSGHSPSHTVATVQEGTQVQLLSHDENDALIIAPNGTQGYVSVVFVRELCGSDCPK